MSRRYPEIVYTEEGMRKGMQVEDANIPIDAKVVLLDALSETGLKRIVVGSFVSPRYTPQMARIDELMRKFHPKVKTLYDMNAPFADVCFWSPGPQEQTEAEDINADEEVCPNQDGQ